MCNNICLRVKIQKACVGSMFEKGFVRCQYCEVYLKPSSCLTNFSTSGNFTSEESRDEIDFFRISLRF